MNGKCHIRDFNDFSERLLIAAADDQTDSEKQSSDLYALCRSNEWGIPDSWIQQAVRSYKDRRFGAVIYGLGEAHFGIQSIGFAEAARLRASKSPTVSDVLASDKVQKISSLMISLMSLFVSFVALCVAILAMKRAN